MSLEPLPLVVLLGMMQIILGGYFFLSLIENKLDAPRSSIGYILTLTITYFPFTVLSFLLFFSSYENFQKIIMFALNEPLILNFTSVSILEALFAIMAIASFLHFLCTWRFNSKKFLSSDKTRLKISNFIIFIIIIIFLLLFKNFETSWQGVLLLLIHSVIVGLFVSGALTAMTWGHWYLVTPSLPKEPLEFLTKSLIMIIILSCFFFVIGLALNYKVVDIGINTLGINLVVNPALWLRFMIGIFLPLILTYFAYKASKMNGMMSATGLLYLVLGAALAGSFLSNALIFEIGITT